MQVDEYCYNKGTVALKGSMGNTKGPRGRLCLCVFKSRYHLPKADGSLWGLVGGKG